MASIHLDFWDFCLRHFRLEIDKHSHDHFLLHYEVVYPDETDKNEKGMGAPVPPGLMGTFINDVRY